TPCLRASVLIVSRDLRNLRFGGVRLRFAEGSNAEAQSQFQLPAKHWRLETATTRSELEPRAELDAARALRLAIQTADRRGVRQRAGRVIERRVPVHAGPLVR